MAAPVNNLPRTVMAILALGTLIVGSLWVIRPFVGPGIWAVTIVVATWPLFRKLEARLGGRRSLAVAVMGLVLLTAVVVPVYVAVDTVVEDADEMVSFARRLATQQLPPAPAWVASLPFGSKLAASWNDLSGAGPGAVATRLEPYFGSAIRWFGAQAGTFGALVVHFLVTVIISLILYSKGEVAARGVVRFFRRLAGERGAAVVLLAGQAIRAVAMGVILTALIQAAVSGIGMLIAGIPQAGLLTALVLLLCIAQLGPFLVMVPGVVWLYWSGHAGRGTFFLVWTLVVLAMDNVIRPWLITRGANLPLLLIFAGVIGGLLGFGVIGLFIGPVILAVSYTLIQAWVEEGELVVPAVEPPAPGHAPAPAVAPRLG